MMDNSSSQNGQDAHDNKEQEIYNYNMRRKHNAQLFCAVSFGKRTLVLSFKRYAFLCYKDKIM